MDGPPIRRLNLIDMVILIASTAIGVWILRTAREGRITAPVGTFLTLWSWKIGIQVSPFLLTTSAGLLVAGTLGSRPGSRELFRQPGLIACLAILVSAALRIALRVRSLWASGIHDLGLPYSIDHYLAIVMGTGELVAASWAALALAGSWRPEPNWLDRSGRVLGAFTILFWITFELRL
jgi:hypothetical protein